MEAGRHIVAEHGALFGPVTPTSPSALQTEMACSDSSSDGVRVIRGVLPSTRNLLMGCWCRQFVVSLCLGRRPDCR